MKYIRIMKIAVLISILAGALVWSGSSVQAAPYEFLSASGVSAWIEVDGWAGSGANESLLVVDWNFMGGPYQTESHAFGFRWDGTAYVSDMLYALHNAGIFTVTSGYGGAFLLDIVYDDGVDYHTHIDEEGSWNLASTDDPYAKWGAMSSDWSKLGEWDANMAGFDSELLANGHIEGINAILWFGAYPAGQTYDDYVLDVPFASVPEPGSWAALLCGLIAMGGLRSRKRK
ncbi:MAG: PEP-CTERM sorting domain-containing protein [Armatimonadetes bacterium]|jgi:hypothetical protein|nr:PEP-CTERM sorting domain-containing protein [Armatimonadota bacterium]